MGIAEIKGSTLKLRLEFVRDRWGVEGVEKVLAVLTSEHAEMVRTALPIGWYPLRLSALLDQAICHQLAGSDERIYEEMGAHSAEAFARRIYSTYFEDPTPRRFLELTRELYKNYYRGAGTRRNEFPKPGEAVLLVEGAREAYRPNCLSNVGFIRRSLQILGVPGVTCHEIQCAAESPAGKGVCRARVTWAT